MLLLATASWNIKEKVRSVSGVSNVHYTYSSSIYEL
jgi:hypothetical protein